VLAEENGNPNNCGMEFGFNAGTRGWGFGLGPGRINGFKGEVLSTAIDTTAFHNYLLRARPGTGYTLAVDGSELGGLSEQALPFVRNRIGFGDGTNVVNAKGEIVAYSVKQPRITSQNPLAGTLVPNKSDVDLTIQDGPATATVLNVVGMTRTAAEATILAASLTVGTVTEVFSLLGPAGSVISQKPVGATGDNKTKG
jgi:hypothetical protein